MTIASNVNIPFSDAPAPSIQLNSQTSMQSESNLFYTNVACTTYVNVNLENLIKEYSYTTFLLNRTSRQLFTNVSAISINYNTLIANKYVRKTDDFRKYAERFGSFAKQLETILERMNDFTWIRNLDHFLVIDTSYDPESIRKNPQIVVSFTFKADDENTQQGIRVAWNKCLLNLEEYFYNTLENGEKEQKVIIEKIMTNVTFELRTA